MYLSRKITLLFPRRLLNKVKYYEIVRCSWMSNGYMDPDEGTLININLYHNWNLNTVLLNGYLTGQ